MQQKHPTCLKREFANECGHFIFVYDQLAANLALSMQSSGVNACWLMFESSGAGDCCSPPHLFHHGLPVYTIILNAPQTFARENVGQLQQA